MAEQERTDLLIKFIQKIICENDCIFPVKMKVEDLFNLIRFSKGQK